MKTEGSGDFIDRAWDGEVDEDEVWWKAAFEVGHGTSTFIPSFFCKVEIKMEVGVFMQLYLKVS